MVQALKKSKDLNKVLDAAKTKPLLNRKDGEMGLGGLSGGSTAVPTGLVALAVVITVTSTDASAFQQYRKRWDLLSGPEVRRPLAATVQCSRSGGL